MNSERVILHVDLDAFYAAVEVRENPALRGKPVVVGSDPKGGKGRGVVSAASYEARTHGIHSAMPISEAYRRCPAAVFLRPRMSVYAEVSRRFMTILGRYSPQVEPLSVDEAFLDVTGMVDQPGSARDLAGHIQRAVREQESLSASIGVAPNKFVAKIASDLEKPGGLVVVEAGNVLAFLDPLPVRRMFGAGPRAEQRLHALGCRTIGDVARLDVATLRKAFSPGLAEHFHALAHGRDARPVQPDRERKSLGHEYTFEVDVQGREEVRAMLLDLLERTTADLRRRRLAGRTVTVKLRDEDFETRSRSTTLLEAENTTEMFWAPVQELFRRADTNRKKIRLVGVSVSGLGPRQRLLFEPEGGAHDRRLARALDEAEDRFGAGVLKRGRLIPRAGKQSGDPAGG